MGRLEPFDQVLPQIGISFDDLLQRTVLLRGLILRLQRPLNEFSLTQ